MIAKKKLGVMAQYATSNLADSAQFKDENPAAPGREYGGEVVIMRPCSRRTLR
jgi:hypothetical protein